MASIRFEHVSKTYDNGVTVVPDLDLTIADKEFVVLVGPSGCGKSTTLRMIAGLEDVSSGDLYIGERRVNDVHPKDRDIAMVFQNYALYPHMTVYKNIAFALELRRQPKDQIDAAVREAAKILELTDYLDRKPKELSGGQRQRVALGRAMVRNPSVFLLDEPLSNLDAKLRTEMRGQIAALHRRLQTTFVYVTHDQTEAMTMGDRIVVMKGGVIQQVDTPQHLYDHPANMFVAGFIGSPTMNFLEARVERDGSLYALVCGPDGQTRVPSAAGELEGYVGKRVVLGVRPEHVNHGSPMREEFPDCRVSGTVRLAELMGAETYLYLDACGTQLVSRVPASVHVEAGDTADLVIDPGEIHVFDPESERLICE